MVSSFLSFGTTIFSLLWDKGASCGGGFRTSALGDDPRTVDLEDELVKGDGFD